MKKVFLCLLVSSVCLAVQLQTVYNPFTGKPDYINVSSGGSSLPLPPGATNYIQNTETLQAGATFYVSSGTVNSQLSIGNGAGAVPNIILTPSNGASNPTISSGGNGNLEFDISGSTNVGTMSIFSSNGIPGPNLVLHGNLGLSKLGGAALYFKQTTGTPGSNYISFIASQTVTTTQFVLPNADGTVGQALITDGAHNLSFATVGGGGGNGLAVSSGSATNSVIVSSPTSNIIVDSNTFVLSLQGTTSSFIQLNGSSVTLQGNNLSATYMTISSAPAAVCYSSSTNVTHVTGTSYTATSVAVTCTATHSTDGFIVVASGATEEDNSAVSGMLTIFRDATDLSTTSDRLGNVYCNSAPCTLSATMFTIDRPGDTSAHTYTVYIKNSATGNVFFPGAGWGTIGAIPIR